MDSLRPMACAALACLVLLLGACGAPSGSGTDGVRVVDGEKVGIEEQLGATLPAGILLNDEDGRQVDLKSLFVKPTVLTLVYFNCPKICSKVMNEVAHTVDEVSKLQPGVDYNLITVSFDSREGPDLARNGKAALLDRTKTKMQPEAWRFLTGDDENIHKLTQTVGFYFKLDKDGDMTHPGAVIFLTKDAKVVRYLGGLLIHPFDMEMAVNDATSGTTRSFMQKVQSICYSYDPEGKAYTLKVNQIILFVTLFFVGIFVFVILLRRKKAPTNPYKPSTAKGAVEGGSL